MALNFFNCSEAFPLLDGLRKSRQAIARGRLVVMPTDTVYGVAADAFSPEAVQLLLEAKGRGRQSPPPVLMPKAETMDGLAQNIPNEVRALAKKFWPGGLTIVLEAQPSLSWDLGDTNGTVAVRVPNHPVALELLADTGPLAVSSANLTGHPAATTAADAHDQLGARVEVYLDAGDSPEGLASTIIDATALSRGTGGVRILRDGVISAAQLRKVLGDKLEPATTPQDPTTTKPKG
jgi:tRNA threonylcarbamoyl adenosine modification protein (Sua5/YciO/YrdC/YwlC family)